MYASLRIIRLLLALALTFLASPLNAQSVYGQVWGHLISASGAPVPGAAVSLISVATGVRVATKSDARGNITISNLAADLYQIEVRADGYKTVQGIIAVNADSIAKIDASLEAGDPNTFSQKSEAGVSVLKLDRTDVATLFDARALSNLPILDRNLTVFQLLVPSASKGQLFIPKQNPQGGVPVNLNGQHFSGSSFQLDGTESRDPLEGIVVINQTLGSVQEMKVTTQGYNAEFGQATAGVVTLQTRSGSNTWHGETFGYRRTGWGESVNPFAPAGVPPSKHGMFGGSLGGPIVKNKLFVFGDYEGTRVSQGANVLVNVPSENVLRTCLGSAGAVDSFCDLSEYSSFIFGTLHDDNQHGGNPFPGNQIPNARVSDQAVALLALLPPSNFTSPDPRCGGGATVCDNYLASGAEIFTADRFDVRSDYNSSSALRFLGRYSFGNFHDDGSPVFGPSAGGIGVNPGGFAGVARTRNQGISTGFTYSLSSNLLTDFRFGYFRYRLNLDSQDYGQIPPIGIPGIFATDTHDPFATGLPEIQIPGQGALTSSIGGDYLHFGYSPGVNVCNCPLREREQQVQFVNNWTRSSGEHILKWGADLRYLQNYRLASDLRRTGSFSFAPNITGLALATFLIGDVTSFQRASSSPAAVNAGERQKRFGFYVQDAWRINPRLTLNYGLRWEIYFPQTVTGAGRGSFLIPNLGNRDPATTYFNVATANNANGGVANSLRGFAPRFGLAYLINPSTVIRVGYSRSFDAGYAGSIFGIAPTQNPPLLGFQNIQSGGFNLSTGPPPFVSPAGSRFSLLDLASLDPGDTSQDPPVPASGATLYALPSRIRVPTVDSWNLTIQHEIASHLYFELAYVGNKGTHVFTDNGAGTYYNLNQTTLEGDIWHIVNAILAGAARMLSLEWMAPPRIVSPWRHTAVFTSGLNLLRTRAPRRASSIQLFSRYDISEMTPRITTTHCKQDCSRTLTGGTRSWCTTPGPEPSTTTTTISEWIPA